MRNATWRTLSHELRSARLTLAASSACKPRRSILAVPVIARRGTLVAPHPAPHGKAHPRCIAVQASSFLQEHAMSGTAADTTPQGNPLPPVVHAKADVRGRVIIVGDVHGCLQELQDLVTKCGYRQGADTLVLVGDLVNKGPDSAGVVAAAQKLGALAVRGNHDDAALAAYLSHKRGHKVKDKHNWVPDLTEQEAEWLARLPFTLRLRDSVCVVHAGLVPGVKRKKQELEDLYTMRDVVPKKSGGWKASEEYTKSGQPWAEVWGGPRHVFFGHDAQRRLQLRQCATGLDTGCVYGGQLTACVLPPASSGLAGWLRRFAARWLGRRREDDAPTLKELGGHIVLVPSRQPSPKKK